MMQFLEKEKKIQTNSARKPRNAIQLGPMGCLGRKSKKKIILLEFVKMTLKMR